MAGLAFQDLFQCYRDRGGLRFRQTIRVPIVPTTNGHVGCSVERTNIGVGRIKDTQHSAGCGGFHFERGFIGFHLAEGLSFCDHVTFADTPFNNDAGFNRLSLSRH